MCDMKNTLNVLNSWLDTAEEKINEHEYLVIKTIQRKQREKKILKNVKNMSKLGTIPSGLIHM